jgi:hypothetical protein
MKYAWHGLLFALFAASCAKTPAEPPPPVDQNLKQYVLKDVPTDIPTRTFVDFGGKIHLIGYQIEPLEAKPGSSLKLVFYWRSIARLGPNWQLFTHLLDGSTYHNFDNVGPLRQLKPGPLGGQIQALAHSRWQPGKVYVDEQTIEIPKNVSSPEVTLAIGVWREVRAQAATGDAAAAEPESPLHLRLDILSGASDGKNRAIVAHLKTGVEKPVAVSNTKPAP